MATLHTVRRELIASVREVAAATYLWTLALLTGIVFVGSLLGYAPVVITSGSMEPSIRPGDVVLLRDAGEELPAPPSVVTFETSEGRLVTHRVVDNLPDGSLTTKGDANAGPDTTPVRPEQVVGVGAWLVPYVGLPVLWVRTGDLLHLLAFVLVTAIVAKVATSGRRGDDPTERPSAAVRRHQRAAQRRAGIVSLVAVALAVPVTLTSSASLTASTSNTSTFTAAAGPSTLVRYLGYESPVDTITEPLLPIVAVEPTLAAAVNRSLDRDTRPGRWLERNAPGPAGRIDWRGLLPEGLRTIDGQVTVEVTAAAGPHPGLGGGPSPRLELTLSTYDLVTGERLTELASAQQEVPNSGAATTVTFVLDVTTNLASTEGIEISLETDRRDADVHFGTTSAPSAVTIDVQP